MCSFLAALIISRLSPSLSKCSIFAIATLTYANIGSFINNAVVEFSPTTILYTYICTSVIPYNSKPVQENKIFYRVNLILQVKKYAKEDIL